MYQGSMYQGSMYQGSTVSMTPQVKSGEIIVTETSHKLPQLQPQQVLIEVAASGFNPVDYKVATSAGAMVPLLNTTGCDVSGNIIECGAAVSGFAVGDAVIGCSGGVGQNYGSATQYLVTDSRYLVTAPQQMSLRQAAAIPLVGITAMDMLHRVQPQANETILVLGALGGVGQMLTQIILARQLGAKVTLACGTNNLNKLKSRVVNHPMAADVEVVDYDIVARGEVVADCVLDTLGNQHFENALLALRPLGRMVTINARNTYDLANAHGKAAVIDVVFMLIPWLHANSQDSHLAIKVQELSGRYQDYLEQLVELIDAGQLKLNDIEASPMNQLGEVFKRYAAGRLNCKPVLHW